MQINNVTSPNFKALNIHPEAKAALKQCDMLQLTKIQEAGNLLKDTQFYNVAIDKHLNCSLEIAKDKFNDFFFGWFKPSEFWGEIKKGDGNVLLFDGLYGISKLGGTFGKPAFNMWDFEGKPLTIKSIDSISKIAKELDIESVKRYKETVAAEEARKKSEVEINNKVDELLKEFSF